MLKPTGRCDEFVNSVPAENDALWTHYDRARTRMCNDAADDAYSSVQLVVYRVITATFLFFGEKFGITDGAAQYYHDIAGRELFLFSLGIMQTEW